MSVAKAARRYEVDRATIWRWLTQLSATGSIEPAPHAGGRRPRISGPYAAILVDLAATRTDATQEELAGLLESRTGLSVSASTVSRALKRLGVERPASGRHSTHALWPGPTTGTEVAGS